MVNFAPMLIASFDGLCRPKNPGGTATWGFVVYDEDDRIHAAGGLAAKPGTPQATNNYAEYMGAIRTLEWLVEAGHQSRNILIRGDSELIIRQLRGEYKVKSRNLMPLHLQARQLSQQFSSLKFEWVPREENTEADAQTNQAYQEYLAGR